MHLSLTDSTDQVVLNLQAVNQLYQTGFREEMSEEFQFITSTLRSAITKCINLNPFIFRFCEV